MAKLLRTRLLFVVPALVLVISAFAINLAPSQAQLPLPLLTDYRAGTAAFPVGSAGIVIRFSSAMPSADYAISVQQRDTAGYSPTSVCTYFNPLHKAANGFDVQHKRCDDGVPVALDVGVTLDWIAIPYR